VVDRVLSANGSPALPGDTRLVAPPRPGAGRVRSSARACAAAASGIFAVWFLVSLSYYGVFVWLPSGWSMGGLGWVRGYGFLVMALAQVPGYALAAHGVERWGRKPTLQGFLLLSAAGFLFTCR
jgi:putative MFS transporter